MIKYISEFMNFYDFLRTAGRKFLGQPDDGKFSDGRTENFQTAGQKFFVRSDGRKISDGQTQNFWLVGRTEKFGTEIFWSNGQTENFRTSDGNDLVVRMDGKLSDSRHPPSFFLFFVPFNTQGVL